MHTGLCQPILGPVGRVGGILGPSWCLTGFAWEHFRAFLKPSWIQLNFNVWQVQKVCFFGSLILGPCSEHGRGLESSKHGRGPGGSWNWELGGTNSWHWCKKPRSIVSSSLSTLGQGLTNKKLLNCVESTELSWGSLNPASVKLS
jgi:hypothetical protein